MARLSFVLCAILGLGAVSIGASAGRAGDDDDVFPSDLPSECTLENVEGVFGFNEDTLWAAVTREPAAFIGILDLRSDGTVAGQFRAFVERGGDVITTDGVEGEWSVEPNCFGFIDLETITTPIGPAELDYQFVAAENATELFIIRNNALEEADAKLLFRR